MAELRTQSPRRAVPRLAEPPSPGRSEDPVIRSSSWFGPATNPSRDIVKCQSTLPAAVCGRVSLMRRSLWSGGGPNLCPIGSYLNFGIIFWYRATTKSLPNEFSEVCNIRAPTRTTVELPWSYASSPRPLTLVPPLAYNEKLSADIT
ncbi:hypothetical protein BH10ACT8_BH10ACT8_10830 [soil metagenome]